MVIRNHYSKELREAVLTAYFTGHESCAAVAFRFNVDKFVCNGFGLHKEELLCYKKKQSSP